MSPMILNGCVEVFIAGALGWVLVELAKFGLRAITGPDEIDQKYTKGIYWLGAMALIIVSGLIAVINGIENVKLSEAVQFGINAPAIVSGLGAATKARRSRRRSIGATPGSRVDEPSLWTKVLLAQSW